MEIPPVGLGTWRLRGRAARESVRVALDAGYRHVDTATMYENEAEVGRAVRDSGVERAEVFVTTKLRPEDAGREQQVIEASLRALDTDYVDLWLIHWPPDGGARPDVWERFLEVEAKGLARAVGVSNYSVAEVDELIAATGRAPAVNQVRWGPPLHDPAVLAAHTERGVVLEGYSPFRTTDLGHPVLAEVAAAHGVTPAQVVVRWHVEHGIVCIPRSERPERIRSNFDVFGFTLTPAEVARIDALS